MLKVNIAQLLKEKAQQYPLKRALVFPAGKDSLGRISYTHLTFQALDDSSDFLAAEFLKLGFKRGSKTLLFLKPSLDFAVVTFALFKCGAIPIFMDPGMGRKNLFTCIEQVKPDGLISVPLIHFLRPFFPKVFSSLRLGLSTGRWGNPKFSLPKILQRFWQGPSLKKLKTPFIMEEMDPHETGAILFTSGGTGPPKGVTYTHSLFLSQIKMLQDLFSLTEEDVDLPGFPLFSLFTVSMGMTSCIPDMNPAKPAQCDPQKLVETIVDQGVTFAAGSPAIWERVADYCLSQNLTLPTLQRVVMFGAPVALDLHEKWAKILPRGTTYTPYGATECLPISNISGRKILSEMKEKTLMGKGTCIGKPVVGMEVRILPMNGEGDFNLFNLKELLPGEVGEIIVKGPVVTLSYEGMPEETRKSKLYHGGSVWHRMGDLGYLDRQGNLWFCGRKVHSVQTGDDLLFSIPCEAIFNQHLQVKRSALIGLGKPGAMVPALVVEDPHNLRKTPQGKVLQRELLSLGAKFPHTRKIQKIYFAKKFPVDVRHNIKIDRLLLKNWVEKGLL